MKIVFDEIFLPVGEDPEIHLADLLLAWERSEKGRWLMENALETPSYRIPCDPNTWQQKIIIYGALNDQDLTYYRLKWS